MDSPRKNIVKDKSYAFALRSVNVFKYLSVAKREFVLLKAATSVWHLYWRKCNGGELGAVAARLRKQIVNRAERIGRDGVLDKTTARLRISHRERGGVVIELLSGDRQAADSHSQNCEKSETLDSVFQLSTVNYQLLIQ